MTGHLYYINEPKALPFVKEIPKPKNIVADMNLTSLVRQLPGTSEISVQFVGNKEKNEMMEWNFVLENVEVCAAWVNVVKEFKERRDRQAAEVKKREEERANLTLLKEQDSKLVKPNPFMGDNSRTNSR